MSPSEFKEVAVDVRRLTIPLALVASLCVGIWVAAGTIERLQEDASRAIASATLATERADAAAERIVVLEVRLGEMVRLSETASAAAREQSAQLQALQQAVTRQGAILEAIASQMDRIVRVMERPAPGMMAR